jgi:tRNA-splicing ligase RtcB
MANLEKLKTLIPLYLLEQGAQQQIYNALALDFLLKLAVMADCHTGYTLPIGGVALLDSVISPEYVGYDIGCGMCYIELDLHVDDMFRTKKERVRFFNKIYEKIPVSFESRKKGLFYYKFPNASGNKDLYNKVRDRLYVQLGTLGGGNHFIEIGQNRKHNVTITLHSGSRNMGHSIASYYMKASKLGDPDLPQGFLHLNGELGQQYVADMNFALEYALANRKSIMEEILGLMGFNKQQTDAIIKQKMVNENHNHAIILDNNQVLHRKGATPAEKGQIGIIPGNMRDGVYVTEGLGNEEYLCSSSHGAGRKLGRKQAKKQLDIHRFEKQMTNVVAKVGKSTLDESPDAYKKLAEVIKMQEDIVIKTIDHSAPIINVKG